MLELQTWKKTKHHKTA
uniref:Coiled-coil domain containing 30 n=1 Tax=Homo sapiens TaxID=9606 RepID=A0A590UJ34_HUMAN